VFFFLYSNKKIVKTLGFVLLINIYIQFGGKAKFVVKNVANLQNHQADGGRGRHGPGGGPGAHAGHSEYPGSQAPQTGQPNIHSSEFSYGRKELFGE
jgi:hypothetical protein